MSKKTIYEKIKGLSLEEMVDFINEVRNYALPHGRALVGGDIFEFLSIYLQDEYKEEIMYIYVLPGEKLKEAYHCTYKKSLWADTRVAADKDFQELYPYIDRAAVFVKEFPKASDATVEFDGFYENRKEGY